MAWTTGSRGIDRLVALAVVTLVAAGAAFADDKPEVRGVITDDALLHEKIVLGNQFLSSGVLDKAIDAFKSALEMDPDNADVYSRLGYAYVQAEDYDMAVKTYRRYKDLKPDDCNSHQSLGFAYMRQGLTDQAIVAYEGALGVCPDDPNAFNSLARAYSEGGYPIEAIEAYRRAIELNPSDILSYENLAKLYYERKLYPEAITTYEAILSAPNNGKDEGWTVWASKRIALMYKWANAYEKAIPYYRTAFDSDPTDDKVIRSLAVCYEETGQTAEAIQLYQALIAQIPDKPLYYYRLGELLNDSGRYQEALRTVREGKNYDTECSAHAYAVIGRALEKMGGIANYKKAQREFRKCVDCGDKNLTDYCTKQIERQELLVKRVEAQQAKEKQGF